MSRYWCKPFVLGMAGILVGNWVSFERAEALDLMAPMSLETAKVLPKGVRNPRFLNVVTSVDSKFGGAGQIEPLGKPLSKQVSWSDVLDAQKSPLDKVLIRSALNDSQLDVSGSPGWTTGQVNTSVNVKVPVLAMGITERLMMAVAVPIVDISVSADTGFNASEDGQKWVNRLCSLSVEQCNTAAQKLNNSVNEKLKNNGYETIQSKSVSGVGDIQVHGRYNFYQDSANLLTVQSTVVLPTGRKPNPDAALDVPTGDGRFGLGASLVYDRSLPLDMRWNVYGKALALLPNAMTVRIPKRQDDPVSPDKETLNRNLGGMFATGTSMVHLFPSLGLTAGAGYSFQFLTKPTYSRGSFASERYSYLEDLKPAEALHSATLMAGFSTVEWYQKKKFVYPFQANVTYSHPFLGRNVTTNDVLAGELVLFF